MLSAPAPAAGVDSARWLPVPPRLVRAARRAFPPRGAPAADDPVLTRYYTDLTATYGMPYDAEVRASGSHHSFLDMGEALLPSLVAPDSTVDLVVVAHLTPDANPLRSASCYLASLLPGAPTAFTVSQNGVAAPFTALRLIAGLRGPDGGTRRALLVIADQSTVVRHRDVPPELRPTADVAVGLRLDADPEGGAGASAGLAVSQRVGVPPGGVRDALREALDGGAAVLVAGPGVPDADLDGLTDRSVRPPAGMPCAAVWWTLAGHGTGDGPVVLAEYDPARRLLSLLKVDGPVWTGPRGGWDGAAP